MADRALDFALRLGCIRLADARGNPNGDHKIRKTRVPPGLVLFHFQQHALHAIGQCGLRQTTKVLKRLHQTADEGRGIATFDKGDKTHARVAQNGRKPVEFMHLAFVLVDKLAPIELDLLARLGFIALNWRVTSRRRPQRLHKFLEDTNPSGVAHPLQAGEDDLAIGAMIFRDPRLDLLFERIKLGGPRWTWLAHHRLRVLEIFAHRRPRNPSS